VGRTIRTCSLALFALGLSGAAEAKDEPETALYWQAQRADLGGDPVLALKSFERLLTKYPQSSVAVDRLFDTALVQGNLPAALKAARARQLAAAQDDSLPLLFYVDAWRRKDWAEAGKAAEQLEIAGVFGFLRPLLDAWTETARGRSGGVSDAAMRANGTLAFYADDQLVYLDIANGNKDRAERRLRGFRGFGPDYARHMAMSSAYALGRAGEGEFANALLDHIGIEPIAFPVKTKIDLGAEALAALFSRLSLQLQEQGARDQALYFARLAGWVGPESAFARMTLSEQLNDYGMADAAVALLDAIANDHPAWSWAVGDKARLRGDTNALDIIRSARKLRPNSTGLMLLEAQNVAAAGETAKASAIYRMLAERADKEDAAKGRRVTYRLLLGQSLDAQGDWPAAKQILEEAAALDGNNPQVLNALGYGLLERREDISRGLALVSKAYELAPQSAAITDSLGWANYLRGDYPKAISLLEQAVTVAIGDVAINEHLGDAYWQAGRRAEARYAWRAAALNADGEVGGRLSAKIDLGWTEDTAAR
jgi:tetratricopeptide (TPR) repeat protein